MMKVMHGSSTRLSWRFSHDQGLHFLPRQGEPFTVYEWVCQKMIKALAFLPIYIAIVVTLVLYIELFGIPFVGGGG